PNPTWTLSHLLWIKKNEPSNYNKINKILFMKDYLKFCFSGLIGTDKIEAEGSLLFDINKQKCSEDLLSIVGLTVDMMPSIFSATDVLGSLKKEVAKSLSLNHELKIITGTPDTSAEIYGSGAIEEGDSVVKLATAGNYTIITKNSSLV